MAELITGTYTDAKKAAQAVEGLIEAQFDAEEISVVVTDTVGVHEVPVEYDTRVAEGAAIGGGLGGALGAIGATLVATGILAAPGLRVLVAGPLLAALRGAVAGLGVGGAFGALAGLGHWKERLDLHAEDIVRGGSVLVGVHAEGARLEQVRELFKKTGATSVTGQGGRL
jgi:hypothetical protein